VHASGPPGRVAVAGTPHLEAGHRLAGGDGVFAGWRWDGERLEAWNDALGFHPLFYRGDASGVRLSTSPLTLARCGPPPAPDLDALAVFARLGFFLGDDTPFAEIRTAPPGARLSWTSGALEVNGGVPSVAPAAVSRAQAVDGLVTLVREAVARRLPDAPSVVPLSGGRDSRHLLLQLRALGAAPLCLTGHKFPPDRADDLRIARTLAARARVPHRRVPPPPSRFHAERRANLIQGLCADEGAWYLPLAAAIGARGGPCWDGIGGDVLTQSRFRDAATAALLARGRVEEAADRILGGSRTDGHLHALSLPASLAGLAARDRAVARLADELAKHVDAASPTSAFYFWNRTRRETALVPFSLLSGVTVLAPFLDRAVVAFLASVPEDVVADGTLHDEAISRAFPAYADLAYAPRGAAPARGPRFYAHWLRYAADFGLYAGVRRRGWLRRGAALPALLRQIARPGGPSTAHRLAPLALYLLQLHDVLEDAP
jgi:asparagine synthase (glutamine-hydrolysing)